jgi:hypothetical protein
VNKVPVRLVFIYIIGDLEMKGPVERSVWDAAISTVHTALGLDIHPPFVSDVFIDVSLSGTR